MCLLILNINLNIFTMKKLLKPKPIPNFTNISTNDSVKVPRIILDTPFNEIRTYEDLHNFILDNNMSFEEFIKIPANGNIEPQECLFKLFGKLNYLQHLYQFKDTKLQPCIGNYNQGTIHIASLRESMEDSLSHGGDSADMVFLSENTIYVTTSKNCNNIHIGDLDIGDIVMHHKQYSQKLRLIIVIRQMHKRANKSSKTYEEYLSDAIIVTHKDLEQLYGMIFKGPSLSDLYKTNKSYMNTRFHQDLTIKKTLELFERYETVVWGHIPRSGKSYIMAQLIHSLPNNEINVESKEIEELKETKESKESKENTNILIITTAPNETIDQYKTIFHTHAEFNKYNIVDTRERYEMADHNIIIVSLQKIKHNDEYDTKSLSWLYKYHFNLLFIDECHWGGANLRTQQLMKKINSTKNVYITATYNKPVKCYDISPEQCITWDLEDVKLCANIDKPEALMAFKSKHGNLMDKYDLAEIKSQYSKYPTLHLLSLDIKDLKEEIIEITTGTDYGLSMNALFMLHQENDQFVESFADERKMKTLCENLFGQTIVGDKVTIFDDSKSIINKAKKIAIEHKSRWFSTKEPLTILVVLPIGKGGDIATKCKVFKKFLETNKYDHNYVITYSASDIGTSIKDVIQNAEQQAINKSKYGVIALTGRQGLMGITYNRCDIVINLAGLSGDMKWQTMFRCMTEAPNKTVGIYVELSIQQNVKTIFEYAMQIATRNKKDIHSTIKYIYEQNLIILHNDEWINDCTEMATKTLDILSKDPINGINIMLRSLANANLEIDEKEIQLVQKMFTYNENKTINSGLKEKEVDSSHDDKEDKEDKEDEDKKNKKENKEEKNKITKEEKEEEPINIINDVFRYIMPIVCILTFNKPLHDFGDLCRDIKQNKALYNVLSSNINTWWKNKDSSKIFDQIIKIYDTYLYKNETFVSLVNFIRLGFKNNVENRKVLSQLIDEYLVPHINERTENAEVSTPFSLRQSMIASYTKETDFIVEEISLKTGLSYNRPPRIFEPCCGKGGFLIDIIDKLSEKHDYQTIVEKCIYFGDINPLNVFICKMLLDPYDKYKLNAYCGDTLNLNIKKIFNVDTFDLIIGNPPYNQGGVKSFTGKKLGDKNVTIWPAFVEDALNMLTANGHLLYVTPLSWLRKSHSLHDLMLSKTIVWMEVWDNAYSGLHFGAVIPISAYLIKNKGNYNDVPTIIVSKIKHSNYYASGSCYLSKDMSIPLGYYDIFNTLRQFLLKNPQCKLDVNWNLSKGIGNAFKLPDKYEAKDLLAIDTYRVKDGYMVKKINVEHPHQRTKKLIIANKVNFKGCLIDDGHLGLCGTHKFYILGENLDKLKRFLEGSLCNILSRYTKYGQDFLDSAVFDYIPDVRSLKYVNENELYKLLGFDESIINMLNK